MRSELLRLENLSICYGNVIAVEGINLYVNEGEIVTIIGPNGAGKTSILNGIVGLIKITGKRLIMGIDREDENVTSVTSSGIAIVPEKRELFGGMTVFDNLLLGGFSQWIKGIRDQKERMNEVFNMFPRLADRRWQIAQTLSGGERQMLAIGRALMSSPKLLMLDEPSLGLAPIIVEDVLNTVGKLRTKGVAILLVEQNAMAALKIADRAYVLETGRITMEGEAREVMEDERVLQTYLGGALR